MEHHPSSSEPHEPRRRRPERMWTILTYAVGIALVYFVIAYILMPLDWKRYVRHHPSLAGTAGRVSG